MKMKFTNALLTHRHHFSSIVEQLYESNLTLSITAKDGENPTKIRKAIQNAYWFHKHKYTNKDFHTEIRNREVTAWFSHDEVVMNRRRQKMITARINSKKKTYQSLEVDGHFVGNFWGEVTKVEPPDPSNLRDTYTMVCINGTGIFLHVDEVIDEGE